MSKQKKVVLVGNGEVAVRIGDWLLRRDDYQLACVVPATPERPSSNCIIRWARVRGVPLAETDNVIDTPGNDRAGPVADIALCIGAAHTLPSRLREGVGRCLNLHNGPLPRYRGDLPINWALKNGECVHGVTLHEVTATPHAGPIVGQVLFPIYQDCDEVIDVISRAADYGFTLLAHTLPILDRITPVPQDESRASCYGETDREALGERRGSTRRQSRTCQEAPVAPELASSVAG